MSGQGYRIWHPLSTLDSEIRLLILDLNPQFAAPLSGCLRIVLLDHQPSYHAISHAWGRADSIVTLRLDGRPIVVTSEIGTCLRYLRHETRVQALWIDAVCIDQQNLTERGNQVELMRHIFLQAAVVHVWLGHQLRQVEELVEDIARASSSKNDATPVWDADAKQDHQLLELQVSLLLSQDWWFRLWIRQEVALAKIVRLHYGKYSIELQQLKEWAQRMELHSSGGDAYVACVHQVTDLTNLRAVVRDRARDKLVWVLADSRGSSVADARDRVYGQLGIVSAVLQQDIMHTDYTRSTEQVFTDFAYSLVRSCRSLHILNQASSQYNSLHALPSWVPDWTSRYNFEAEKFRFARNTEFRATAGKPMPEPFWSRRRLRASTDFTVNRLGVRGHTFALCKEVGPACEDHSIVVTRGALSSLVLSEWLPLFRKWHNSHTGTHGSNLWTPLNLTTGLYAQFAATMLRGVLRHRNLEHPERILDDSEAVPLFDAIMEACSASQPTPELDTSMDLHTDGIRRTRFFIGSDGRPGLGPTNSEPGDVLALLLGGNMPYVLRKDDRGPNVYTFIGECYVHGAMDGELFDEDLVQDIWLV